MRIASRMRPEGRGKARSGQNIYAASASQAHVQAAIDAASNGDWVFLPAGGSATWATGIVIPDTKGVVLDGNGSTITDAYASGDLVTLNIAPGNSLTRVTNLSVDSNGTTRAGTLAVIKLNGYGVNSFRIDHCTILNLRTRGVVWIGTGAATSGVIDHNAYYCPYDASSQAHSLFGAPQSNWSQWARGLGLGGPEFIFIEDNDFYYDYDNDGPLDAYNGAKYVFRYNRTHGPVAPGHHGADSSSGYRGVHSFEVYGNTFDNTAGPAIYTTMFFRSGTGVVHNNTVLGSHNKFALLRNYRSHEDWGDQPGYWPECDGRWDYDGNTPGGEGYPALDQIGTIFTDALNGTYARAPLYVWANDYLGGAGNAELKSDAGTRESTKHILANRDYYNAAASFDGSTGVGSGLLASRPSSGLTTGVGYWATDTQTLYVAISATAWSAHYAPYTYPHPLTLGA